MYFINITQLATRASCLDAEHSNRTVPGWQTAPHSSPLSMWEVASHCSGPGASASPPWGHGTDRATGSGSSAGFYGQAWCCGRSSWLEARAGQEVLDGRRPGLGWATRLGTPAIETPEYKRCPSFSLAPGCVKSETSGWAAIWLGSAELMESLPWRPRNIWARGLWAAETWWAATRRHPTSRNVIASWWCVSSCGWVWSTTSGNWPAVKSNQREKKLCFFFYVVFKCSLNVLSLI